MTSLIRLTLATLAGTVLLQNTFAFMKSLNDAGVVYTSQVGGHSIWPSRDTECCLQIYPDSNHLLLDVQYHMYRSIESYLLDCFKMQEPVAEGAKSLLY